MNSRRNGGKEEGCTPSYYVRVLKKLKVKLVIRLNKKMYDSKVFEDAGIQHHDLFFVDGTCPPRYAGRIRTLSISAFIEEYPLWR